MVGRYFLFWFLSSDTASDIPAPVSAGAPGGRSLRQAVGSRPNLYRALAAAPSGDQGVTTLGAVTKLICLILTDK